VKMPDIYVEGIEELVRAGRYSSRSEVIRTAVRELLKRELWSAGIPAESSWLRAPNALGYSPGQVGLEA
ncbi:MAG: ribbon-helix-helix domain-containing protein, partial [Desulfurococcales archaeon]|nr:ribbon-helix-helix domain-containing protein [Desulfurococcales archaeon]